VIHFTVEAQGAEVSDSFCFVVLFCFVRYVVVNDIVVEANAARNSELATWGFMSGFVVMMALDVALG
jgi:zinc transporter ZupT